MTERGRDLFDRYILSLLADANEQNVALEARVEELRVTTAALDVRMSKLEEEVGRLHDAIDAVLERELKNANRA